MRNSLIAALAGLLFGVGLVVSGMANPAKVLGFLDIGAIPTGGWDPSLAFVMLGALLVATPAFAWAKRRQTPFCAEIFHWPQKTALDRRLLAGSAIFGIGWGLVGFCPGPAFAAFLLDGVAAPLFVLALLGGMLLHWVAMER
jgi:uncharacterized membrane protein YedE/YeeE